MMLDFDEAARAVVAACQVLQALRAPSARRAPVTLFSLKGNSSEKATMTMTQGEIIAELIETQGALLEQIQQAQGRTEAAHVVLTSLLRCLKATPGIVPEVATSLAQALFVFQRLPSASSAMRAGFEEESARYLAALDPTDDPIV